MPAFSGWITAPLPVQGCCTTCICKNGRRQTSGASGRLVIHPQLALENARAFGLSPMEEDIIGKHMWPLTAPLPYYKESYMVSLADKICATLEMAHLYGLLGVRRNLRACRPALLRRAVQ